MTTFPADCADFLEGPGFRLTGLLGGYAFRSPTDILAIAADPRGGRVLALGAELVSWDAATGARSKSLPLEGTALALDPTGRLAVVGDAGGSSKVVDLGTGVVVCEKSLVVGDEGSMDQGIQPPVSDLAIAGPHVAAYLETAPRVQVFRLDGSSVASFEGSGPLAISPDGALVAAGAALHDAATGARIYAHPRSRDRVSMSATNRASFSVDGAWLARSTDAGDVELWDVARLRAGAGAAALRFSTTMPIASWDRDRKPQVAAAVFALADGRVVTSTGSELQVWSEGRLERTLPFHADTVVLGPGDRAVWGLRRKRTLAAIDLATGGSGGQEGHLAEVAVVTCSPRAPLALTGGADARVLLWHLPSGTVLRELRDAWGTIAGAAFFPDGRRVAAIDKDRMFVWDAATSAVVAKLDQVSPKSSGLKENLDLDVSPDGRHALVCTYSDHVLLWDAESNQTVYCREVPGVRSAAFGATPSVAILGASTELVVFDLATGEAAARFDVEPDGVRYHAHFVFDRGRRALRACTGRGIFLYDLGTGARSLVELTDDVNQVLALSPDGRRAVVTTSDDPTEYRPKVRSALALVDVLGRGRSTISLASATDEPTSASFSFDGKLLLVGTARGVVLQFDVGAGASIAPSSSAPSAAPATSLPAGHVREASPLALSDTAVPPQDPKTQVMAAFAEMSPSSPAPMSRPAAAPSAFPATARSAPPDRVIVAPVRASLHDDMPLSSMHPLGSTSPRAGSGPSSAKPGSIEAKREEAIGILKRVGALYARGAYNEALAFAAPLRKYLFDSFPPGDALVASAVANLAELHTKVGELKEAESLHREALEKVPLSAGQGSETFAITLSNAGNFALEVSDLPRAEELHRRALEIRRVLHGERHPLTAQSTSSLGFVLSRLGRADMAEPLYRSALEAFHATVGGAHPEYAKTLHNLGVLLGQSGRLAESEGMLAQSLATRRSVLSAGHPELAQGLASLGTLYLVSQRPVQAEPLYREALDITRRSMGDDSIETSTRAVDLAVALRGLGRAAEAIPLLTRALEVRRAKLPEGDTRIANLQRILSELGVKG